jgi:hypothetical protein
LTPTHIVGNEISTTPLPEDELLLLLVVVPVPEEEAAADEVDVLSADPHPVISVAASVPASAKLTILLFMFYPFLYQTLNIKFIIPLLRP